MEVVEKAKVDRDPPRASPTLHYIGFLVTGLWVAGLLVYGALNHRDLITLAPNELGDFAAGAFAPLAFLWLVLGFFQQGKELRYSGQALWLQGEELRNSVEQQRDLVNVTREQLQFENDVLQQQRAEMARNALPIIKFNPGGWSLRPRSAERLQEFRISNHGKACTGVKIAFDNSEKVVAWDALPTGDTHTFRTKIPAENMPPFKATVSFLDERMVQGSSTFLIEMEGPDLKISQVGQSAGVSAV